MDNSNPKSFLQDNSRFNKQVDYSIKLQQLIESLKRENTPHPELWHHHMILDAKRKIKAAQEPPAEPVQNEVMSVTYQEMEKACNHRWVMTDEGKICDWCKIDFPQPEAHADVVETAAIFHKVGNYTDPTPEMLSDPIWNAIWNEIKRWDINVPDAYRGYCGATGNHATAIYKAMLPVAAAHFEAKQEQIKDKREEIALMRGVIKDRGRKEGGRAARRILATLTAQLAELQKGWKG